MNKPVIALFGLLFLAHGSQAAIITDDRDLTVSFRLSEFEPGSVPLEISPDSIESDSHPGPLALTVLREDHGKLVPVEGLEFKASASCSQQARLTAKLETPRFAVTDGSKTYSISLDAPCTGAVRAIFKADTAGGQALGIWQVARRAQQKLEASVDMSFWSRSIRFIWPADGDYYSFDRVNITRGDQWDVVGHEMGHAVYDQAGLGDFGGGSHKIDECYSEALALSEGWASFFSAWVSVDLADPDAKFEFMVPRRAPIRFETIPADVCRGEKNEWRVTGFFWDLMDVNNDGENANESFVRLWNPLLQSHVGTASEAAARLKKQGIDPSIVDLVWNLNF